MAIRAQQLTPIEKAGAVLTALVFLLLLAPLVAVALRAETPGQLAAPDWAAVRFTLLQAGLSALLSVGLAIPVARALARRRFRLRGLLVTLTGAPFILPVIVAVFGLLAVFGRAGWLNAGLEAVGLGRIDIYGLTGVVMAHVFLNLPLAVRLLLQAWMAVPSERIRLAASLGVGTRDMHRYFERPLLLANVPGAATIIFLICTTSFAVALTLGGGPRATTVELAIYQAFRFDFDLARAALLGAVQVAICLAAGLLAYRVTRVETFGAGLDRPGVPWPDDSPRRRLFDAIVIALASCFLLMPLLAVLAEGAWAVMDLPASVWRAALRSLIIALAASVVALGLALPIAFFAASSLRRASVETVGFLSIAVSPLVIGTGFFLILRLVTDPVALSLPITALVNALVALPFLLRVLLPAIRQAGTAQGRLADALGLTGWWRLRYAILPRLRRPLGFGAGLAAAFSIGDLGVIALFSAPSQATLPLELYRLMGAYRTDDAQGAAVLLLLLSLAVFWAFDRGGRLHAPA